MKIRKIRGYFGVVFFEPKFEENIGTAIRSAHCFGADFIGVIGARYKRQATDTMATEKHVPIFEYKDLQDFPDHVPTGCAVIGIECDAEQTLETFDHPERAIYVLGGEDRNLPQEIKKRIRFETSHCVNMAVAASIVLYDRNQKKLATQRTEEIPQKSTGVSSTHPIDKE